MFAKNVLRKTFFAVGAKSEQFGICAIRMTNIRSMLAAFAEFNYFFFSTKVSRTMSTVKINIEQC